MNLTIGDTAVLRDIVQSKRGDFLWVLPFIDVAADGTETDTNLTGCDFRFEVFELDGVTSKTVLTVGDGITVTGNDVSIRMANADFAGEYTKGCKYPYYMTYTNAADFTKCLFEGTFMVS